ncbi:hypothetical protein [Litorilituus sediminis]|uniref:hypothetical protein n=1 Tax=Litorilituus sediminis TaxID=718192 RepID=UPI001476E21C|nr:hypothetical protein [Litorilituus sediminis]
MSDDFLGAIILVFCIWGGMIATFKFFTGGNLTAKPIADNTILDELCLVYKPFNYC